MRVPLNRRAEEEAPPRHRTRRVRVRADQSIHTRVLAIALIPCAALLVAGTIAVSVLAGEARAAQRWSEYLNKQLDPLVVFVVAVQDERSVSLAALNGDPQALAEIGPQRTRTDAALAEIGRLAPEMQQLNAQAVAKSTPAFMELAARTPVLRQAVDVRQATPAEVDDFYMRLADVIATGLEGLARYTPDSLTAAEEMTAADLIQAADLHSRAVGIAAAAVPEGTLRFAQRRTLAQLVGAYRHQLEGLTSRFTDAGQARYRKLVDSAEWRTATHAEDELAERGNLPLSFDEWRAAERVVDAELIALFHEHAHYANNQATSAASESLTRSIVAGVAVAITAVVAFVLAMLLANRLVRRLRSLRSRSLELANETLPSIVRRLHDGEHVDVDAETAVVDDGADEIGQVAEAFGAAQRTAMSAAAAEARTRKGFNKVFLDIAHRSQVLVRQQMSVLDIAEAKQDDPEHLELLFQLDHLATRARRNAENLVILGGGHPGRRWRDPVVLEQIVRSAVSETHDLTRVSGVRLPEVRVLGNAVADLIHLLAELIDNATSFSPPESLVSVHGNVVGRGVAVEIEDQGLGIRPEERQRLNELLADPPDFQEMALAGQRNLGLFVVGRLAQRHGVTVTLQQSAYGGVRAVVLIPDTLLDQRAPDPVAPSRPGVERVLPASSRMTSEPVPRLPGRPHPQLPPWPGDDTDEPASAAVTAPNRRPAANAAPPSPAAPGPRKRAPLPQRQRMTHLAPELRLDEQLSDTPARSPERRPLEQIRSSMSSFQRGTHRARESAPPNQ